MGASGSAGGELVSTGWPEAFAACRGWTVGHVKSRLLCYLPTITTLWPPNIGCPD